jgi:hypothetical protein
MIKLETIKRVTDDILSDVEWVNDSHSEAEYEGIKGGLNRLIRHIEETNQYNDLKEVESEDLRQELQLRGYFTDTMWHVEDVMCNYRCTSEQAMTLLEKVLKLNHITEGIYSTIDDEAEYMEYRTTDDNPLN